MSMSIGDGMFCMSVAAVLIVWIYVNRKEK